MINRSNLDDPSAFYGLSHSATEIAEIVRCEACGVTGRVDDMEAGHRCAPRFNATENPKLAADTPAGEAWRLHNNRRLEAEAALMGETMPVAIEKPEDRARLIVNHGAYDAIEARVRELQAEGRPLIEAVHIAYTEAKSSESQQEAEAEDGGSDYLGASVEELMGVNKKTGGHGSRRSGGRFKNQKPVDSSSKRQRRYDEILSDDSLSEEVRLEMLTELEIFGEVA